MDVSKEMITCVEVTPEGYINFPPAEEGYGRFILLSLNYQNEDVAKAVNDANIPARIELSIVRNNDNPDDYIYWVNAFNRVWKGRNLEETFMGALRDITEDYITQTILCLEYRAAVYNQSVLEMSNFELVDGNGKPLNSFSMQELHRMNYDGFPSNITNPEVIFEERLTKDKLSTPEDETLLTFCDHIGGVIPGVKLVKAIWHDPDKEEKPTEMYYCNFPCGSVSSDDPIKAIGDAAYYEMKNHLRLLKENTFLKAENERLKEELAKLKGEKE